MSDGENGTARSARDRPHEHLLYRLTTILLLAWSAVAAASLWWNVHRETVEAEVIAHREAKAYFVTDRALRLWSTDHGGVYVEVAGKTAPSPYLAALPERDVTTPSGRLLTLMNPAQMIREIDGYGTGVGRARSRITSLHPLRPENGPDEWERAALQRLATGEEEVGEITGDGEVARFRLMRPLVTKAPCLKCHAAQGFQVGDIQGGIVVSLPMAPLWAIGRRHTTTIVAGHALLWLTGVLGIGIGRRRLAREIVERRAVETHLRRRTADLRHLFDHAPVSLWREDFSAVKQRIDALRDQGVTDLRRHFLDHPEVVRECAGLVRVVAVNHAAVALHRASSQEELLAGLPKTFTKSSYEVFREELVTCAAGKTEMEGEAVVQTVDGEVRHVLIKVFIDPHTPEWSNAYVSIVDLTPQKKMEAEIRDSEHRYRTLVESTAAILWEFDLLAGRFTYVSPQATTLLGYPPEAWTDLDSWAAMIHPDDRAGAVDHCATAIRRGQDHALEYRAVTATGETVWLRDVVTLILEGGRPVRAKGVMFDISENKQTEAVVRDALREKEVLLREIHHRVKNNFQVIVSLLKLQSRHIDDPKLKAAFEESVTRVHTMAMVHERLYGEGNLATVDGGDYLQAIVTDLQRLFGRGARITTRVETDPAPLAVDTAIPCGLIANELVSNCFKHAFPGGRTGEIRVALRRTKGDSNGSHYRLTVRDDGIGIDPALSLAEVKSVGLRLVTTLTENQLGGSVELRRDHGTSFSIEFTVPSEGDPHDRA